MRLTEREKKTVYIKAKTTTQGSRGAVTEGFSSSYALIKAIVHPLSSQISVEAYGQKANEMLVILYEGSQPVNEGDGVCVNVPHTADPDFRVVSKKVYSAHSVFDLEKVVR